MTEYDLTSLILETSNAADLRYQNWIQATFAVLVAAYFTSGKINRRFLAIIGFVFFLYSMAQLTAIIYMHNSIVDYNLELRNMGKGLETSAIGITNIVSKYVVHVVGTFSTLYYMWFTGKSGSWK